MDVYERQIFLKHKAFENKNFVLVLQVLKYIEMLITGIISGTQYFQKCSLGLHFLEIFLYLKKFFAIEKY